jgi:hypothetical protein
MKKRNLLILFLLFNIIFGCIQEKKSSKNSLDWRNLNGRVKTYQQTIYRISKLPNDSLKLKKSIGELLSFNKNRDIDEKISFKRNGKKHKRWVYKYDRHKYNIGIIEIKYPNDTLTYTIEKYDNFGNNIESFTYNQNDSLLNHSKSVFNNFNKKTESIIIKNEKSKNQLIKVNYQYDNDGNEIKTTRHYKDSSKTEWFTDYNSFGNEIEWKVYDREGLLDRRDVYLYDSNQNLIGESIFDQNNNLDSKYISVYDNLGNETETIEYYNDFTFSKELYFYNSKNDNIKTLLYNSDGILTKEWTSEYKYDKFDNLIEELNYENGEIIEKRSYEIYYWK